MADDGPWPLFLVRTIPNTRLWFLFDFSHAGSKLTLVFTFVAMVLFT